MDTVPLDFCARVAATWRCCKRRRESCDCQVPTLAGFQWKVRAGRDTPNFGFDIYFVDGGRWKYRFHSSAGSCSMGELMKRQDLKELRVSSVFISNRKMFYASPDSPLFPVENMEKLLNFVSYLSNEPRLDILDIDEFGDPEGSKLLEWLGRKMFSSIWLECYLPIFDQMLRNHQSRREYPRVTIFDCKISENLLAELLKSGHLKHFSMLDRQLKFSSDVMEGIIENFMSKPHEYNKRNFEVFARFDQDSAEELLQKMVNEGLCAWSSTDPLKYSFVKQSTKVTITDYHSRDCFLLECF